ncbi:similar to Saccharomyces cerevisiae YPL065W VPS28 Component of the ESCRT-I complex (Stp22p, Srn2p, Vps28p, and Mvb12p) [Maudiozyma barnettii]|uniref:Vacuolar protein sorting-associated protein 28 n=1 Tax=Maudiozyma barnettii TaxID=61262 RepID=A0A8H2VI23_9SACH|nr:ESCRT-I subunit protein VPS28 [Kazachstania barnettii]CAB4255816.1 similar to Saccharomyces cerevisiae YPL065W VPS28 Component of the ESCRT-I complex (Stp22p, Srn2p, Vps28p, and Mvb12p) [Kazachstania barnettii]CAD1784377.1 similar to Saccharomyces cerevisiae YPL065W VPS28 Component of the ESCRT-I complex (Stp22p, Srn2p, Vps28p, and Mvb12p) [Kazachstania barnettii]
MSDSITTERKYTEVDSKKILASIDQLNSGLTSQEKETKQILGEIYSIVIALDYVEKAYLRDLVSSSQYTNSVNKLLAQYKTYLGNEEVRKAFVDLDHFKRKYDIVASNAITRLERGIPITVEHAIVDAQDTGDTTISHNSAQRKGGYNGKDVAEATGNFITVMDALKLNYKAKDQLHPLLAELLLSINKVTQSDFEHRKELVNWIIKINKMRVEDTLSDNEIRELLFDLDLAYKSFYSLLE